jgi:DNA polymerase
MTKKDFNQNAKFEQELISSIEPDFNFSEKPQNRINSQQNNNAQAILDKAEQLSELKKKINSIENCNLKNNSKNLILGDGNVNSPIMLIGEAPGKEEEEAGLAFKGDIGELLKKMLLAIKIKLENVYISYSINYRPPEDRKPTSQEIKRYSIFLKEHISIINPKILVLMGSTAMEAVTGMTNRISNERGNWKEIILKNRTYPIMITFSPSYLIRFPENKKHSWDDLKKIRKKIQNLNIKI